MRRRSRGPSGERLALPTPVMRAPKQRGQAGGVAVRFSRGKWDLRGTAREELYLLLSRGTTPWRIPQPNKRGGAQLS